MHTYTYTDFKQKGFDSSFVTLLTLLSSLSTTPGPIFFPSATHLTLAIERSSDLGWLSQKGTTEFHTKPQNFEPADYVELHHLSCI